MTVGDAEVRLRKSKKKKKRSSMIFISEERERTSTLDCKRVRTAFFFPIGRRDGQVTSRVGRKHQRKMSRAMTLPLHDLCLPLAVKEAGVPQ